MPAANLAFEELYDFPFHIVEQRFSITGLLLLLQWSSSYFRVCHSRERMLYAATWMSFCFSKCAIPSSYRTLLDEVPNTYPPRSITWFSNVQLKRMNIDKKMRDAKNLIQSRPAEPWFWMYKLHWCIDWM